MTAQLLSLVASIGQAEGNEVPKAQDFLVGYARNATAGRPPRYTQAVIDSLRFAAKWHLINQDGINLVDWEHIKA